jgi:tripartite-type tricarboxylate transporter receptor subunit TctC
MYNNLQYDTVADFAGVIPLANLPSVLVVSANSPFKSVQDLINTAKAKPGQLNFASAGVGSATHVNTAKFLVASHTSATHIPFKGTPETISETISGRVDFMFTPVLASIPSIRDGRMRPLAVSTSKRNSALPDVPTVAESGIPGFEFNFWIGLLAPAKTPRDIVNKLNAEVTKIMQQPEVRERMAKLGAEAMPMSPEQFDAYIKEEVATLGAVMKAAGTKAQ